MTDNQTTGSGGPGSTSPKSAEEIASTLRLRPQRTPVTRLSRKVLAGGTALALVLVFGAVLWALQQNRARGPASEELYSTDHHNVADGLAGLPRDYAGIPRDVPRLGPPLPGDLGRPIVAAQAQAGPLGGSRTTADEPGKRGCAHQQGLCIDECAVTRGNGDCRGDGKCDAIVR